MLRWAVRSLCGCVTTCGRTALRVERLAGWAGGHTVAGRRGRRRIRTALRLALEDEGYDVAEAERARTPCAAVAAAAPDLMVVDLMLGSMDGFTFIREVRRDHAMPIIVVSARDDTHDIVAALEAGADDYVTKPFEVKEITARLRALRRRAGAAAAAGEQSAIEVVLDPRPGAHRWCSRRGSGTVRRGSEQVPLTLTEFRLLCELARRAGPGAQPAGAARTGLGPRLLRRRAHRRRPRAPAAHEDREGPERAPARGHRPRPGLPAGLQR